MNQNQQKELELELELICRNDDMKEPHFIWPVGSFCSLDWRGGLQMISLEYSPAFNLQPASHNIITSSSK